jgi:glycosyltransferase involved in cell wall biosynthesis
MKIGFLTADLTHHHGWGHYSLSLVQALHDSGADITLLTARNSPPVNLPGLTAHRILPNIAPMVSNRLLHLARTWPEARSLLAACDLIHTTCEIYAPLGAAIAGKRPHLLTVHGSYAHLPRVRRWPVNWLYQWAYQQSHLVCVSHYTQQIAQSVVPGATSVVVPNGIQPERYQNLPPLKNPSVSVSPDAPLIISVGGVKARKGTLPLVRAIATVRETLPDVQCVIIGTMTAEPEYVAQVQQEIQRLHLEETVHLTGFVDNDELLGWHSAADLFVMPSMNSGWKFEGFGLVYLAAGAAGLPVIGTRNCGAEEAIDHEQTGLLVSQAHVDKELPEAILQILTQPELAAQMGAAGRQKAQSQTWQHIAEQMMQVYQQSLPS